MTFRRNFIAAAIAAVALSASFTAAAQNIVLKATDTHPAGYPTVVAVENMGKKLEAATNGRIKMQMFPGAVLGQEKEVVEQTQIGAIQIARISLGVVGPVAPDVDVFNMPFVFHDIAHMRKVIDGPIGDELLAKVSASQARLIALGWMDGGAQPVHQEAGQDPGRPQGREGPHDGQPAVRGHHERHGRQRHFHGLRRSVQCAADRCD
ncbi:TRAP transporter substrate-binding protein DctP [Polaromonas sp. P2-4]|nr:TRAP transporter substrate-binding protein DctP [Polaromonas sp. P2-4]